MRATPSTACLRNSFQAHPERCCRLAMTQEAEGTHVRKIALSAAFRDWHDMVRIPQRFPAAFAQPPLFQKPAAGRIVEFAHISPQGFGVDAAVRADAFVAVED